jgi:hypothetical protein
LKLYGPARSDESPDAAEVVAPVLANTTCDAAFGAINVARTSPTQVWAGPPNVVLSSTFVGAPDKPATVKVTLRGVGTNAPQQLPVGASGIAPTLAPLNVAAGCDASLRDETALDPPTVAVLASVAFDFAIIIRPSAARHSREKDKINFRVVPNICFPPKLS